MATRRFLPNVVEQFETLNRRWERIAVMHGFGREFRNLRYSIFHKKGGKDNHFQGVQRLGNYLLVTGSYPYRSKRSDLLVVRLDSRPADPGPWGSNMMRDRDPPERDLLVNYFRIDTDYWHPGGFSLLDSLAVIPLENSKQSKIVFVDLEDPDKPKRIEGRDVERSKWKAGACAITPLADDRTLLAVWSDSDKPPRGRDKAPFHLDLYRSTHPNSTAKFTLIAQFFPPEDHDFHRKFQCLDFVWERKDDGEMLYLIGFENTAEAQPNPLSPGENVACLFEVDLSALPKRAPRGTPPSLDSSFLTLRKVTGPFDTSGNWCNMDAGSCAYIDSNEQLIIYSVYHFLAPIRGADVVADLVMKCLEFRATKFASMITRIEDAWIELHEDPGLQGRRLALLGPFDSSIGDTAGIFVDDKPFDVAASVRCQLPDDRAFVLYREAEFRGAGALVITGSGGVSEVDVFATGFGGRFRSCRFQPESVAVALPQAIVV